MLKKIILFSTVFAASLSCQKKPTEESLSSGKYLYVASGLCYSGNGITTFTAATASNLVYRIDTTTGQRDKIIADYQAAPATAGDTPTSVEIWDDNQVAILVRNGTTGRAIELAPKEGGARTNFGLNPSAPTILSTAPSAMKKTADGGLLIIRTGFIEKVSSTGVRLGAPWVNNNLGATCGTANALFTTVLESSTSKIITMNAAASPNNRLISVPASGANGSCLAAQASPVTTTFPVAAVYDSANSKLIVAYAGSTTADNVNSIYAYDYNESTGVISNAQEIYDAFTYPATYNFLLFGISSMALDAANGALYVSTAISTATTVVNYNIEKLNYNPTLIGSSNTSVLTRSSTVPFYGYGVDTKCISSLKLGN